MIQPPPERPRSRALADLDARIAEAEAAVEARRLAIESSVAAGGDGRMAFGQLRVAEGRLAQLRESRRVLLEGDGWEERPRKGRPETSRRSHRRKAPDEAGGR
jgi:hypothetical protein